MTTPKVAEIKKLDNGKIAVRWVGKRNFNIIDDPEISNFLIWMIVNNKKSKVE